MTGSSPNDLPPPMARRWLIAKASVRTSVTVAVLVTLYFVLPMEGHVEGLTLLLLVIGLVVLAAVIVWHIRAIIGSRHPGGRAVQALVSSVAFLLVLFASIYYLMGEADHSNFTQHLTRVDALYFTVTTFSTVGFGDITASSQAARIVVTVQIITDLIVLGAVLQVLVGAVRVARGQQQGRGGDEGSAAPRDW